MDNKIVINNLKSKVQKFCEDRDWTRYHNPKDLAIMIVTEASELLEIFRYKNIDEINEIMNSHKKEHVEEEIADVFFGILRFCQLNNIDLSNALENKLLKNNLNYPVEKSKGSNKKYNEL